ncbi:MAG: LysE family transporter [Bacteroidaceae bacterium]|nr:LysE family transporter [Bacteroidaceae bacterium]MBR3717879.1 LysE family transporter [Bacteroidaceae bacterium]
MPLSQLPTLLLYILIVGYTPGPANIYSLTCAMKYGRKQALVMWRGLLTGFTIAVIGMAVLSHLLGEALGDYVAYLKYLGAAYILWLAFQIYRESGAKVKSARLCTYWSGLVMQLTNAKMLLFDLTVFSLFVLPYSDRLIDMFPVAALLLLAGPGANLLWLLAGDYLRHIFGKYQKQIDIVMALLLVLCAVVILLN